MLWEDSETLCEFELEEQEDEEEIETRAFTRFSSTASISYVPFCKFSSQ